MIKAIIFDADGTILDSVEDILDAVNYALSKFNLPNKTLKEVELNLGYGASYLLLKSLGNNSHLLDDVLKIYKPYLEKNSMNKTKPFPHIYELLLDLKKEYKLGVVSNKHNEAINIIVNHYFPNIFDIVIGEQPNYKRKPNPDLLNLALNKLNVKNNESIYVGDTEVDIKTAKNAGVPVIAVSWGFRDYDFLLKENPNYLINHVKDILKIIKG